MPVGVPTLGLVNDHSGAIAGRQGASRHRSAPARRIVGAIQRMEASEAMVRGNVDSLVKLIAAFDAAGIEMIDEGAASNSKGRGVRLKITSGSAKTVPDARSKASGRTRARA